MQRILSGWFDKLVCIVVVILLSFQLGCVREIVKDESTSKDLDYFESKWQGADVKTKMILLDELVKVNNAATSIVLVRGLWDSHPTIRYRSMRVLNGYRRFTLGNWQKKHFFQQLYHWWKVNPKVIIKQMGYLDEYKKFIEQLKKRQIWTEPYNNNPLLFFIKEPKHLERILAVFLIELERSSLICRDWLDKNEQQQIDTIKLPWKKESKELADDDETVMESVPEKIQMNPQTYFWAIWLIGHLKLENKVPFLVQLLKHPQFVSFSQQRYPMLLGYRWVIFWSLLQMEQYNLDIYLNNWKNERNPWIHELMMLGLVKQNHSQLSNLFLDLLRSDDSNFDSQRHMAIIWTLSYLDHKQLMPILLAKNYRKKSIYLYWQQLMSLELYPWLDIPPVVFEALLDSKDELTIQIVLKTLWSFENKLSSSSKEAQIHRLLNALYPLLKSSNKIIVLKVVRLLGKYVSLPSLQELDLLFNSVIDEKTDDSINEKLETNELMLYEIINSLAKFSEQDIFPLFSSWIKDERLSYNLRCKIASMMYEMKDESILELVLDFYKSGFKKSAINHSKLSEENIFDWWIENNNSKLKHHVDSSPEIKFWSLVWQGKSWPNFSIIKELIGFESHQCIPLSSFFKRFAKLDKILGLIYDKDIKVNVAAIESLDHFKNDIDSWNPFMKIFKNDKTKMDIRVAILNLFAKIRYEESIFLMLDILSNKNSDRSLVNVAIQSLAKIGKPVALEPLIELSASLNNDIRLSIIHVLPWFNQTQFQIQQVISVLNKLYDKSELKKEKIWCLLSLSRLQDLSLQHKNELYHLVLPQIKTIPFLNEYLKIIPFNEQKNWIINLLQQSSLSGRQILIDWLKVYQVNKKNKL